MGALKAARWTSLPRLAARAEDWLLAGWIALAAPLLVLAGGGTAGPFDTGHPLQGLLQLTGFCGALACLATRNSDGPAPAGSGQTALPGPLVAVDAPEAPPARPGILVSGAVGPLVGGLLLVGGSAFSELGLSPESIFGPTLVAVVAFSLLQSHLPTLRTGVRRALVTPYLLSAGGLFWDVVHQVTGSLDLAAQFGGSIAGFSSGAATVVGLLILAAAVYYAMLIFAPRQIAEREGGPIVWLVRFALFILSVTLGLGWISLLAG